MRKKPPAWKVPFLYIHFFGLLAVFLVWVVAMFVIFYVSDKIEAIRDYFNWK